MSKDYVFNTFASLHLIFEEINEPFFIENASNLTNEFLNDNFNDKINKIYLLKLSYKNSCVKSDTFSKRNGSFFPKNEVLRSEKIKKTFGT